MIREDKNALLCDLAETYRIYDLEQLPIQTVAVLACGLRENSRIKMKLSGATVPTEIMMLAHVIDRLSVLVWQNSEDGAKGRNMPESLAERLLHPETAKPKITGFDTVEEFERARSEILERAGV